MPHRGIAIGKMKFPEMNPFEIRAIFAIALIAFVAFGQHEPPISREEFLSVLDCAAESGDPVLCDNFLYCDNMLPFPYHVAYNECVPIYNPKGIGECTNGQQLYHSAEDRRKINDCIVSMVDSQELTDEQLTENDNFQDCIRQLGEKCFNRNT
ncbi:uncharacterized protein CDAR_467891 [Caerostris darwini]|uniref:Uncharacterized protein n=1 Tax=Caerostris darwini TaxID=1538125 RepID=A0AAV4MM06_9ARAC|nr:uncharacterized protein CDAR_467891 [Caerostris darwini]